MGSCGEQDGGKDMTDYIVAITSAVMNAASTGNPNDNPNCGKTIQITTADGKTISATVKDTCPTCGDGGIDLSEKTFLALFGSLDVGKAPVTWHFTS